jgi:hypothetical protein
LRPGKCFAAEEYVAGIGFSHKSIITDAFSIVQPAHRDSQGRNEVREMR